MKYRSSKKEQVKARLEKVQADNSAELWLRKQDWLEIATGRYRPDLPTESLLSALTVRYPELNAAATEWLSRHLRPALAQNPLDEESTLYILGRIHHSKTEIKKVLKSLNIGYATKPGKEVTHVLVGHKIKAEDFEFLKQYNGQLLTESMFLDFWQSTEDSYLTGEESSAEQLEHIASLLLHEDETNVELAFGILKSGGVPKELMTELFIIYKFHETKKFVKQAKKYLKAYGSSELNKLLTKLKKQWWSLNYDDWLASTELEPYKIYQYEYLNTVLQPSLFHKALKVTPQAKQADFLKRAINEWSYGQEMEALRLPPDFDLEQYADLIYGCTHLRELVIPAGMDGRMKRMPEGLGQLRELRSLILQTALEELPEELYELPHLIYLSVNMISMKDRRRFFRESLQGLEYLELGYYRYAELPEGIEHLQGLKQLHISGSDLEALPPGLRELKQLEVLNLNNHKLSKLPDILYLMPNLKRLNLRSYWTMSQKIDVSMLREALPDCEIIA